LFHWLTGTPFADSDQGEFDGLTLWEQMDNGKLFGTYTLFFIEVHLLFHIGYHIRASSYLKNKRLFRSLIKIAYILCRSSVYTDEEIFDSASYPTVSKRNSLDVR
jgi:hypothetical protein